MVKIGTRRSVLALWQANFVKARLETLWPKLRVEIVEVVTTGDRVTDRPLASIGGKALFVKEIEDKLLNGEVDLAVHSMKDVPASLPEGLKLICTLEREDPTDAFVARDPSDTPNISSLPAGARLGTGSARRACQLRALRPDLVLVSIRGNVDTRLRKLGQGDLHGLILASAALKRLNLSQRITQRLDSKQCLPAVGQGAMAIEGRAGDMAVLELVEGLNHPDSADCVEAERAFLSRVEGGCHVPVAALAKLEADHLWLRGLVGEPDGSRIIAASKRMPRIMAHDLGIEVAHEVLERGGERVLANARRSLAEDR